MSKSSEGFHMIDGKKTDVEFHKDDELKENELRDKINKLYRTIGERPKFFDSPFFVMEPNNWHMLEGASDEHVKEFEEFKKWTNQ
jgi:hypothetical protein